MNSTQKLNFKFGRLSKFINKKISTTAFKLEFTKLIKKKKKKRGGGYGHYCDYLCIICTPYQSI